MTFAQSISTCLKKYADFKGRAGRSEYWWFALFLFIGSFASRYGGSLYFIWTIVFLLPNLAVSVRRLHDTNHSGWWILFPVVNLVFLVMPTKPGANRFGGDSGIGAYTPVTDSDVHQTSSNCPQCGKLRLPGQNYCQGCGHAF